VFALFLGFSVKAQETNNERSVPCKECLTFGGVQSKRVNSINKRTYYTYRYFNQCTTDIKIKWDCEYSGAGGRTIYAGKYEDLVYSCGTGGLDNIKVECKGEHKEKTNSNVMPKQNDDLENGNKTNTNNSSSNTNNSTTKTDNNSYENSQSNTSTRSNRNLSEALLGTWVAAYTSSANRNGDRITFHFSSNGTGYQILPDVDNTCYPYYWKAHFNYSLNNSAVIVNYTSIDVYCGDTYSTSILGGPNGLVINSSGNTLTDAQGYKFQRK